MMLIGAEMCIYCNKKKKTQTVERKLSTEILEYSEHPANISHLYYYS